MGGYLCSKTKTRDFPEVVFELGPKMLICAQVTSTYNVLYKIFHTAITCTHLGTNDIVIVLHTWNQGWQSEFGIRQFFINY